MERSVDLRRVSIWAEGWIILGRAERSSVAGVVGMLVLSSGNGTGGPAEETSLR